MPASVTAGWRMRPNHQIMSVIFSLLLLEAHKHEESLIANQGYLKCCGEGSLNVRQLGTAKQTGPWFRQMQDFSLGWEVFFFSVIYCVRLHCVPLKHTVDWDPDRRSWVSPYNHQTTIASFVQQPLNYLKCDAILTNILYFLFLCLGVTSLRNYSKDSWQ